MIRVQVCPAEPLRRFAPGVDRAAPPFHTFPERPEVGAYAFTLVPQLNISLEVLNSLHQVPSGALDPPSLGFLCGAHLTPRFELQALTLFPLSSSSQATNDPADLVLK